MTRVAWITGAGQGIGRTIALRLADDGDQVVISDINPSSADTVVREIIAQGGHAVSDQTDVSQRKQVEDSMKRILDKFNRLDVLVNNAAIQLESKAMHLVAESDWDRVLAVNLKGVWNTIIAASKPMIEQRYGKIVNIASIAGITGSRGQLPYSASKGGVIALTMAAAKELMRYGINVNAVAPGFVDSPMTHMMPEELKAKWGVNKRVIHSRLANPDEIANCVCFLASNAAQYVTGVTLAADGGFMLGYP
jgi:3-oxoacyl-[acyl-carrier protein] reductase